MTDLGELLQQARAYKGVSLREVERATRINRDYLQALEAQDFAQLPPATYARGIVRNYATFLGLDAQTALDLYERQLGVVPAKHDFEIVPASKPLQVHSHWAPNFAIIAFMVVISAIVFAWMYSAYFQRPDGLQTRTIGIATVTPVDQSLLGIAPTPQPTTAAQGGGVATATPTTAAATATMTVDAATSTPEIPATAAPDAATAQAGDATSAAGGPDTTALTAPALGQGSSTFVVWVTADVWVNVTVDGVTLLSEVLPAGAERIFYGESVAVSSGNAAYVQIYVNGNDMGGLGPNWDSTFVWP